MSCSEVADKISSLTESDLPYETIATLPGVIDLATPLVITTAAIKTEIATKFVEQNTSTDLNNSIGPKELEMEITSPDDRTFEFLESITVEIEPEGLLKLRSRMLPISKPQLVVQLP